MSAPHLRFYRLLLDARPTVDAVNDLLRRLAQHSAPRPLAFETRASETGITWLVGTEPPRLHDLRSLLAAHLAGARLVPVEPLSRPLLTASLVVRLPTTALPLNTDRVESVVHAIYEAFSRVGEGETLALQVALERGFAPRLLSAGSAPAPQTMLQHLGITKPPAPLGGRPRTRLESQASEAGLALTIRLGASGGHPIRTRALLTGLRDALRLLEAPGARLRVTPQHLANFDRARPDSFRLTRLSTPEVVPLLGLPISDRDLPGLPLHPRRPLAPHTLQSKELVFAKTSAPGDARPVGVSPGALLQHVVITGPTGSGKSTVIANIAEQWIRARRPIALLDPKRQLVDHLLARLPSSAADRVVVLDPTDSPVVGFNPLDTEGRNADVVVDGILSSLRVIFDDGWGPRTEDLLLAGLRSLALAGETRREPYTLIDLPRLFTDAALRRSVVGSVQNEPVLASFWSAFEAQSETARAAQIAPPLNKLRRFLLRPNLVAVLGQSRPRFRVRDLYKGDKALLVPLNDSLVGPGSAQLLGSLLVAELFQAAQERALEHDPRARPALVAIDEAQRFIHLPTALEDALATSRSYGVAWLAAHQYRAQLSPSLRAGFDINAQTKLVYRSTYEDARDYARLAGNLASEDFMALDPYELYCTVMHDGAASPWFSARALPPRRELGFAQDIRRASRQRYGAEVPIAESSPPDPGQSPRNGATHRKSRSA